MYMLLAIIMCVCRKPPGSNSPKWFKFDDGDVTEAKIEDEEVSTEFPNLSCH